MSKEKPMNLDVSSTQGLRNKVLAFSAVKSARALHAYVTIARDPNQLGKVFDLRSSLEDKARIGEVMARLRLDETGETALRERPRLGRLDVRALAAMPKGSLGERFGHHMIKANLDPTAIPTLGSEDAASYVSAHLYETHDIWHVVTGFGTDVAGEMGLQAFYFAQFPAFLSAAILSAALLNTMLYAMEDRDRRMEATARGWDLGKRARQLFGVDWAARWNEPLESVRESLGVPREGVPFH